MVGMVNNNNNNHNDNDNGNSTEDNKIHFSLGSALDLNTAIGDGTYDVVTMVHVGMNISDKEKLFAEVHRVLNRGGIFAIYDVMLDSDGILQQQVQTQQGTSGEKGDESVMIFPLPWASNMSHSFVTAVENYKAAAIASGFPSSSLLVENNRGDFAREFMKPLKARLESGKGLPPFSMLITFGGGNEALLKMKNLVTLLDRKYIAPVELIFRKE